MENKNGTFVVTVASVNTRPGHQRISIEYCKVFKTLWAAEDAYNDCISEINHKHRHANGYGYSFDNYDRHACDFFTVDDVNYHLELTEA